MNQCTFLGNLTRDPKLSVTNNNKVVTFGIATNRWYKRADGESVNEATFLEMEAWDSGAQRIYQSFSKGDGILVECSAKNSNWTNSEGIEQRRLIFRVSRFWPIDRRPLKNESSEENNE